MQTGEAACFCGCFKDTFYDHEFGSMKREKNISTLKVSQQIF